MRHVLKSSIMTLTLGVVIAAFTAGCSTTPLRTEGSTSGISAAEAVGAAQVPQASLYLQMAKDELARARVLAGKGDDDEAKSMLKRAEVDAELAVVLSREDAGKTEALAAIEQVHKLQQQKR